MHHSNLHLWFADFRGQTKRSVHREHVDPTKTRRGCQEAHFRAVEKLAKKYQNHPENPYSWTSDQLKAAAHPYEISMEEMKEYSGNFGPRTIKLKEGKLFYQRDTGPEYQLIGMEKDLFMVEDVPYFRLQFIREQDKIVAVEGIYDNGRRDKNMKMKNP